MKERLERDLKDLVEFADASNPRDQVVARAFGCLLFLGEQDTHDGARVSRPAR